MNFEHLRAFIWLRWTLRSRLFKRAGALNAIVMGLMAVMIGTVAVGFSIGMFCAGVWGLANVPPAVLMYVWDGLIVAFMFFWMVGLITELQRSEALSLTKFLHLPVSSAGVCLVNYISSLVSMVMIIFAPAMLALCLGLIVSRGVSMVSLLPLLAAFLFMMSALAYQFQGWLAAMMTNPRKRRTVIALVTVAFVILVQGPNLAQMFWRFDHENVRRPNQFTVPAAAPVDRRLGRTETEQLAQESDRMRAGAEDLANGRITRAEYEKLALEHHHLVAEMDKQEREIRMNDNPVSRYATAVNFLLPPGWLAVGALKAAEGGTIVPILAFGAMSIVGAASLWRSYRTTVLLYTGYFSRGKRRAAPVVEPTKDAGEKQLWVERTVPGASEHVAAIAWAGLRGLTRAPEAKMMLLGPVILVLVFISTVVSGRLKPDPALRPLLAVGGMTMVLITMMQLMGNQFGFDRAGFRVFVLSPVRRRDILFGKNLSTAPIACVLAGLILAVIEIVYPLPLDELIACVPLFLSMYLIFSLWANLLSILGPMSLPAGTMKPANPKVVPVFLQVVFVLFSPVILSPLLLPWGIKVMLQYAGIDLPISAILTLAMTAAIGVIYWLLVDLQGDLLARREKKILEIVTSRIE